jgi:hypothetical protein
VRVAWEGDFEALHSLAIVNRAVCTRLLDRGHDVRLIAGSGGPVTDRMNASRSMPGFASGS